MLRKLGMAAWITAVWIALWGDLSWANVVGGLLVSIFLLAAVPLRGKGASRRFAVVPALLYAAVFVRDLTMSSIEVARQVFWPVERLRPAILAADLESADRGLLSLVANTISLTPGTLTLEVDGERARLWIHVLHLEEGGEGAVLEQARALERLGARVLGVDLAAQPHARRSTSPRKDTS